MKNQANLEDLIRERAAAIMAAREEVARQKAEAEAAALAQFERDLQTALPELMVLLAPYHTQTTLEHWYGKGIYHYCFTIHGQEWWLSRYVDSDQEEIGIGGNGKGMTCRHANEVANYLIGELADQWINQQQTTVEPTPASKETASLGSDLPEITIALYRQLHDEVVPYLRGLPAYILTRQTIEVVDKASVVLAEHNLLLDAASLDDDECPF